MTVLCVTLRWFSTCAMCIRSTPASPMKEAAVRRRSWARNVNVRPGDSVDAAFFARAATDVCLWFENT